MIATELGVWSTSNLHDAQVYWQPQTTGMANVRVDMLTLRKTDNMVLAASHGRGLFQAEFPLDLNTGISDAQVREINVAFNRASGELTVEMIGGLGEQGQISLYTLAGKKVMGQDFTIFSRNIFHTGQIAPGVYLVKVIAGGKINSRKILIL